MGFFVPALSVLTTTKKKKWSYMFTTMADRYVVFVYWKGGRNKPGSTKIAH